MNLWHLLVTVIHQNYLPPVTRTSCDMDPQSNEDPDPHGSWGVLKTLGSFVSHVHGASILDRAINQG